MRYGNIFRGQCIAVDRHPEQVHVTVIVGDKQMVAALSLEDAAELGARLRESTGRGAAEKALLLAMARTISANATRKSLSLDTAADVYERAGR